MYTKSDRTIIWLDLFEFLTLKKKEEILSIFDDPSEVFDKFKKSYDKLKDIVTAEQFDKMCYMLDEQFLNNEIVNLESKGIRVLTYLNDKYPQQFFNYPDRPLLLYYKGDISLLKTACVGIVGTRKPTIYGRQVTEKFAKALASSGATIVSGLADGVDSIAHSSALSVKGKTIAVMGSGFEHIYPPRNFELEKQIEQNGLVITEYRPEVGPAHYHYPVRNRIIAGLSRAVLITEASQKSGTMHTKNYCLDYGIDLYAVPGEITSFASSGTNAILKSCQGAIALSPDDIIEDLHLINSYKPQISNFQLSFEEQAIFNVLDGEMHFDEIQIKTKIETKRLLTLLTTMELNGFVKKLSGNYYCKN
ncbi:MAG TPA: DNA-protecting protein DprA [Clostridiales bacterium]|nr:DNA-protecting protein DprA [Clostridiales bacterium]